MVKLKIYKIIHTENPIYFLILSVYLLDLMKWKILYLFLVKPSTWTWFQMLDLVFRVEIAVCLSPNPVVVSITCYNN